MRFQILIRVLVIVFLFPLPCVSQSQINFGKGYDGGRDFLFDITNSRNEVYDNIPTEFKGEITDRSMMRYANNAAQNLSQFFSEGVIYSNWVGATSYLNDVLNLIKTPAGLGDKSNVKAYILRNAEPNAFMTPSGAVFITVGLLNELNSESGLAAVISHELAHYNLHHNLEGFIKEVQGDFDPGIFFNSNKAISRYSIENELDADYLAAEYLIKSGYSHKGFMDAFNISKKLESKELLNDGYSYKIKETTHPNSDNRSVELESAITRFVKKHGIGENFLISEIKFKEIKEESRYEILNYLLFNYDYQTCLEKAFRFHIYDPNNSTFVYYLMESIRRLCYFDDDQWSKEFIVDKYFEFAKGLGVGDKHRIRGGFFDEFRYHLLELNESEYEDVVAKFYWEEEPKFATYEQAFQFYFELGKLLDEPECYLSNALSLSFNKDKMHVWLKKYLSYDSVRYQKYAESLLLGNIYSDLNDNTLVVMDNFIALVKQGPDYVMVKNDKNDVELKSRIDNLSGNKEYLYIKDLKEENMSDYIRFVDLDKFSLQTFVTKGRRLKLHELDPSFWLLFEKYGINEVEFVNCIYKDRVKGKYTKEAYLEVADSSIDEYLEMANGKKRILNVFISQISMKSDEDLKKIYFETDIFLDKEGFGFDQSMKKIEKGFKLLN